MPMLGTVEQAPRGVNQVNQMRRDSPNGLRNTHQNLSVVTHQIHNRQAADP